MDSHSEEYETMQVTSPCDQIDDSHIDSDNGNRSRSQNSFASVSNQTGQSAPTSHDKPTIRNDINDDVTEHIRDPETTKFCEDFIKNVRSFYPGCLLETEGGEREIPLLVHSAAFCDALMRENETLKKQLSDLHEQNCNLEREKDNLKSSTEHDKQNGAADLSEPSTSSTETTTETISRLQARVKTLESQRAEVLRVNKQWDVQYRKLKQSFDQLKAAQQRRECNESRTTFKIRSTETASSSAAKTPPEQKKRRDADILLINAKKEIRQLMHEKAEIARNFANAHAKCQPLKREISQLRETNHKLESDKGCLEAENQRLNLALEAAYSIHHHRSSIPSGPTLHSSGEPIHLALENDQYSSPPSGTPQVVLRNGQPANDEDSSMNDLRTQVQVLQQQVKIYREDFETERRDRERSQIDRQRLDEMLTRAQHEVEALTQQVRTHEFDFKQEKREKERLKRQLQWQQASGRDLGQPPQRARYHAEPENMFGTGRSPQDPPDYFTHRYHGNDEALNPHSRSTSRRRRQTQLPQYDDERTNHREWIFPNHFDADPLLSYPPRDGMD